MKLGVFDSGIGGEAIAAALCQEFPDADITTVNDRLNLPYGDKSPSELIALTNTAIQPLLRIKCDIIIIACNSATSAAIEWLRDSYPKQKFIGLEPMIRPAAEQSKSKIIAVCATPATLRSVRYKRLVERFASDCAIIEPDCSTWAKLIEDNAMNESVIRNAIEDCLEQGADVIVLGCTHYHWIRDDIQSICKDRATIIEPSVAIAKRVRQLMNR